MLIDKNIILRPTNDYVFRRIFGHVGNEDITKGLISSIINQEVKSITLDETPITEINLNDDKIGILDVKARLDNNLICDIEMQVVNTKNVEKRLMFYWSKLYTSEIHTGQAYSNLHKIIVILIADFELQDFKSINKFHTKWQIREEDYFSIILTDMLEIHIIELPKLLQQLDNSSANLENKDVLWSMFILHPEKMGEKIMEENEDIKKAKQELDKLQQDKKEQYLAELRMKYILDQREMLDTGFENGVKQGRAEGEKETKIKIAKKLLLQNIPIKEIMEITELTEDEINDINV